MVGDEPHPPYDRPPLSKQVLLGKAPADTTALPMRRDPDAEWRLGVAATGLDPLGKRVLLADGESLPYDRLLIATGTRARPWPNPDEAPWTGCSPCAPETTPRDWPSGSTPARPGYW